MSHRLAVLLAASALLVAPSPSFADITICWGQCPWQHGSTACPGDCDRNGRVSVDELAMAVGIALDGSNVSACEPADTDADGRLSINDLVASINGALTACGYGSAPTPGPTLTQCDDGEPSSLCLTEDLLVTCEPGDRFCCREISSRYACRPVGAPTPTPRPACACTENRERCPQGSPLLESCSDGAERCCSACQSAGAVFRFCANPQTPLP
jgi:hypothetical protein